MATVHVARRDGDPRVCVLKQLHAQLAEHEETSRRFHREAHIASYLDHPGIARVVDAGVEDGVFCLALEFIAGQTVEQLVKRARSRGGTLPFEVTVHVMLAVLGALAHAHEATDPAGHPLGIVHRDLSPRNLMVGYDGAVKVIDFGIAKGQVDDHRTAVGTLMGTPYYMSPEQASGEVVDARSDIYTLGAVLFEMFTGHRLVTASGRPRILMSVAREPAPPLSERNPHAPRELGPVLAKALEKDPERRYPSARLFSAELAGAFAAAVARTSRTPGAVRLGFIEPPQLGAFLLELAPEGEAKARALLEAVKRAAPVLDAGAATRVAAADEPAVVPTRLADPALFQEHTRAADPSEMAFEPTMYGLPEGGTPASAPVRAAGVNRPRSAGRWGWIGAGGVAAALLVTASAVEFGPGLPAPVEVITPDDQSEATVEAASREEEPAASAKPETKEPVVPKKGPARPKRPNGGSDADGRRASGETATPTEANRDPSPVRSVPKERAPQPKKPKPEGDPKRSVDPTIAALRADLGRLRADPEPDAVAAYRLAAAISDAAERLDPKRRARVLGAAERVHRTRDGAAMLDALTEALAALEAAPR